MNDEDHKAAIAKARAEGIAAGLDLAMKVLRAEQAAKARFRPRQAKATKHDWLDHISGISLIDRMMGIK